MSRCIDSGVFNPCSTSSFSISFRVLINSLDFKSSYLRMRASNIDGKLTCSGPLLCRCCLAALFSQALLAADSTGFVFHLRQKPKFRSPCSVPTPPNRQFFFFLGFVFSLLKRSSANTLSLNLWLSFFFSISNHFKFLSPKNLNFKVYPYPEP